MYQQPDPWAPAWARRAVFYHINPFGFLGAPPKNDLSGPVEPRLADLRAWYDHITGLGIDAICLGPVFQSLSGGRDVVDYLTVDRRLGDVDLLKQIVSELHERGVRVILDGGFHHTSRTFFAFRDLCHHKRDSRYAEWYLVDWSADGGHHDGFSYACGEENEELPRLNLDNADVRRHIFDAARYWLGEVGVDGWRLASAYDISPGFWWEFRRVCKTTRPDCFLLGELMHGDYRAHVAPDLLDSGTNYEGSVAVARSLVERSYCELQAVSERAWHSEWGVYKDLVLINSLGSGDTPRILAQVKEAAHVYPALIYLMTAPGIPCLYYGDEVGLRGDPHAPMPAPDSEWPDRERGLYDMMRRLIAIRKNHPALMFGDFSALAADDPAFAYLRRLDAHCAVIILNAGDRPAGLDLFVGEAGIPDGAVFYDALDEGHPEFRVRSGMLYVDSIPSAFGQILVAR